MSMIGEGEESRKYLRLCLGVCQMYHANVAQSVEHIHGKDEVTSSILVIGSNNKLK